MKSYTVTIYSLDDIVTLSNWTKNQQLKFFKWLDKRHSWGDTAMNCITLKDVKVLAKKENLTVAETSLPDNALVEIDWFEPVDDE